MKFGELLRVQLDEIGGTPTWHMIFPEGDFKHPVYGDLKFDGAFLDEIKRNFDTNVRGTDVFIDYKHTNGESAGWVEQLDYRPGEGLFALIKWTAPGAAAVNGDIFRYFSPEFGTHFDEVTGKKTPRVLFAVALTNIPYLKRLPAVTRKLSENTEFEDIDVSDVELDDYAGVPESDFAGPHRSFPIRTAADVKDAWNLRGHAADPEAVGRKIIAIARRKGFPIPHAAEDQKHDETTLQDKTYPPYPSQDKPRPRKARVEGGVKEMSDDDETDPKDDDGEEDDLSKTKEKDMSELDVSTVHNNELASDPVKKKKLRRPQGNEGPTQPTTPTGAKPSITRARTPDASGANQQMSEKLDGTQVDDKVTLAEKKMTEQAELIKRLSERLDAIEPERVALSAEVTSLRKSTLERDIRDERRTLSEDSSYKDSDGKAVAYKFAIPSIVLEQYETMALEQPGSRAATFAMLSKLREVGLAPMAEIGTARLDTSHDPDAETKKFRFDDDRILAEATKIALSEGKVYESLPASEKVAFAVRAEKQVSSR